VSWYGPDHVEQCAPGTWFKRDGDGRRDRYEGEDLLPLNLPIYVRFPRAGRYTGQVWFLRETGAEVLKMEQPFHIVNNEA
jgi:hypothetical protein